MTIGVVGTIESCRSLWFASNYVRNGKQDSFWFFYVRVLNNFISVLFMSTWCATCIKDIHEVCVAINVAERCSI